MKHLRHARVAALAATAVLTLTACGGADESASASPQESSSSSDAAETPSETPSESPSTDASAGASTGASTGEASAPIAIGKTVKDTDLGDEVTFLKVVRNFPIPASAQAMADNGAELVLVQVKVTTGSKYYSSIDSSSFEWGVGTTEYSGQSAGSPDVLADMEAAGYAPLEDIDTGKTGTGWVSGFLKKPGDPAGFIAYRRVALQGSDGKTFPKKVWKVTLPVS